VENLLEKLNEGHTNFRGEERKLNICFYDTERALISFAKIKCLLDRIAVYSENVRISSIPCEGKMHRFLVPEQVANTFETVLLKGKGIFLFNV